MLLENKIQQFFHIFRSLLCSHYMSVILLT